jgi:hypothetical protein
MRILAWETDDLVRWVYTFNFQLARNRQSEGFFRELSLALGVSWMYGEKVDAEMISQGLQFPAE